MCIAASYALANLVDEIEGCLVDECILPTMQYENAFIRQATAVGLKAIEQGIAKIKLSEEELLSKSKKIIESSQGQFKLLMEKGYIPQFTDYEK